LVINLACFTDVGNAFSIEIILFLKNSKGEFQEIQNDSGIKYSENLSKKGQKLLGKNKINNKNENP
jgi:hypothetical protein